MSVPARTPAAFSMSSVLSASGLPKRNLFRLPDPFVVVSVDGVEKFASSTVKKSLNPFWNEHFDV